MIHCPAHFTIGLPDQPLDGELYSGRGKFQELMGTVKELDPNWSEWDSVKFMVFDSPLYHHVFQTGTINNPNFKKKIKLEDNLKALGLNTTGERYDSFDFTYKILKRDLEPTKYMQLHEQTLLPFVTPTAIEIINKKLEDVTDAGGEGLILRHPASVWEPIRTDKLLKVKKLHDEEAFVIDWRTGQGKYLGMLGSLSVRFRDVVFDLSGFTDEERTLCEGWRDWAVANPGKLCSSHPDGLFSVPSPLFYHKDRVTFRYRELSTDGIPKEARYLRRAA